MPDTVLTIEASQLLSNDRGSGLTVVSVTSPTALGGTATLNGQVITYTAPPPEQPPVTITDSFNYTARSESGLTSSATVFVEVTAAASLPLGSNATIQIETLLAFCPPGAEFVNVQNPQFCEVYYSDFDNIVLFIRRNGNQNADQSSFEIVYSLNGQQFTIRLRTPSPDGPSDPGGGSGGGTPLPTEPDGRFADGGYATRSGTRTFLATDLATSVYPVGTRIRVIQYDIEYTESIPNHQITESMTIAQLSVIIDLAAYLDVNFNGAFNFASTDGGHYDVIYRLPATTEWFHADQLFTPNAPTRPSVGPSPNDPLDVPLDAGDPPFAGDFRITLTGTSVSANPYMIQYIDLLAVCTGSGLRVTEVRVALGSAASVVYGSGYAQYNPATPPQDDASIYTIVDGYGRTTSGVIYVTAPAGASTPVDPGTPTTPTTPVDTTDISPFRQIKSAVLMYDEDHITLNQAPTPGNLMIAVVTAFYYGSTVQPDWTEFFLVDASIRDGYRAAYKIATSSDTTIQLPYRRSGVESTVTLFEIPAQFAGVGTPFTALDLAATSFSHAETPGVGQIVLGVASSAQVGNIPSVTGANVVAPLGARVAGGRCSVQPFFVKAPTTVTATVPANQEAARFTYFSVSLSY